MVEQSLWRIWPLSPDHVQSRGSAGHCYFQVTSTQHAASPPFCRQGLYHNSIPASVTNSLIAFMAGLRQAFWVVLILFPVLARFVTSQDGAANGTASLDTMDALFASPTEEPLPAVHIGCVGAAIQESRRPSDGFRNLTTLSPEECCTECHLDRDCASWERQRTSGLCMLNSDEPDAVDGEDEYDSGTTDGVLVNDPDRFLSQPVNGGETIVDLFWLLQTDGADCGVQEDAVRTGTPLPSSTKVDRIEECCTTCDDAVGCVAWNFETATGQCNHLDTVSDSESSPSFSTGTTVGR